MKGTLQGDFTRLRYDRGRGFGAVRMQQGRVQLDADWNELVDLLADRIRTGTLDLVGTSGAPAAAAGYAVTVDERGVELGTGGHCVLVGGGEGFELPAEARERGVVLEAEALPRGDGPVLALYARLETQRTFRLAWELSVDGGGLRWRTAGGEDLRSGPQPGLVGRRHTVRVASGPRRTEVRLDGRTVASGGGVEVPPGRLVLMVGAHKPPHFAGLLCALRLRGPGETLLGDWRFGEGEEAAQRVPDRGPLGCEAVVRGGDRPPRLLPVDLALGAGRYYVDGVLCTNPRRSTFGEQPDRPGAALPQPAGREPEHHVLWLDVWERGLTAAEDPDVVEPGLGGADTVTRSRVVAQVRTLRLDSSAAPDMRRIHTAWQPPVPPLEARGRLTARRRKPATSGLDNALYRIEVHDGGEGGGGGGVTFKWSRDNASVVFPVAGVEDAAVEIGPSPRDLEGLEPGAWVELVDDAAALGGEPPPLHRVTGVDPSSHRVVLAPPPRPAAAGERRVLRLWDQRGAAVTAAGVLPAGRDWQELENGVEVRFSHDEAYRAGDYWLVPARAVGGDVEWPAAAGGLPQPRPPHGVEHATAPIALLSYLPEGYRLTDLRRTFLPHAVDAVRKDGDWMDGPLDVRADLAVQGDAEVAGRLRADLLEGRLATPSAVGPRQLATGSVTPRALAPEVGVVPDGASLLSASPEPPRGFAATGWVVEAVQAEPGWIDRGKMPVASPGPLVSVALGGRIYTLLESGEMWAYDPAEDTWSGRPGLPLPLRAFAAAADGGRIWVAGGVSPEGERSGRVFEHDPLEGSWVECAPLPTPRSHLALVALDGALHALGGLEPAFLGPRASRRHEVYDPVTDTWSASRRLRLPRAVVAPGAAAVGERIHLAGGEGRWLFGRWGDYLGDRHHVYRAGSQGWSRGLAPLPSPRVAPRLAAAGSRLAAVGGESAFGWVADCDLYDPSSDTWRPLPSLHQPIPAPGVAAIAGTLHVTGAQRAAGRGVLMEVLPVSTTFHVHRRVGDSVADEATRGEVREAEIGDPAFYDEF
jgi:hypothetical protein